MAIERNSVLGRSINSLPSMNEADGFTPLISGEAQNNKKRRGRKKGVNGYLKPGPRRFEIITGEMEKQISLYLPESLIVELGRYCDLNKVSRKQYIGKLLIKNLGMRDAERDMSRLDISLPLEAELAILKGSSIIEIPEQLITPKLIKSFVAHGMDNSIEIDYPTKYRTSECISLLTKEECAYLVCCDANMLLSIPEKWRRYALRKLLK